MNGESGGPERRRSLRRRLAVWLIPIFFWSLPALLTTRVMMDERGISFTRAFLAEGIGWMLWAVATPGILALVRRLPIERPHRGRNVALHIVAGLFMGAATGGVTMASSLALGVATSEDIPTGANLIQFLVVWGLFGLLFYAAAASVGLALDYHRRLRERERAASRLESQLVEARLNALRMQLQPHFLFNALNSVSMLVRQGESSTAVRMVARLSDLLRYVLDGGRDSTVPLRAEIDFIGRYLEIEQLRFGDRLHVNINVQEEALDTPVPGLLLQPLVENAVRHAAATRTAATTIDLDARTRNGRLEIRLRDDGPGLPADFDQNRDSGIGLANTRSRLEYTYGQDALFSLEPREDGGTEVRLSLPLQRGSGRHA